MLKLNFPPINPLQIIVIQRSWFINHPIMIFSRFSMIFPDNSLQFINRMGAGSSITVAVTIQPWSWHRAWGQATFLRISATKSFTTLSGWYLGVFLRGEKRDWTTGNWSAYRFLYGLLMSIGLNNWISWCDLVGCNGELDIFWSWKRQMYLLLVFNISFAFKKTMAKPT